MQTIAWTYENGQLVSRNEAGQWLFAWQAEEAIGIAFANLLNYAQPLGRSLLFFLDIDDNQK